MNNLINNLLQCCAAPCQQLLTVVKPPPQWKNEIRGEIEGGGLWLCVILKSKIFFCKISLGKCRKSHLRYSRFQNCDPLEWLAPSALAFCAPPPPKLWPWLRHCQQPLFTVVHVQQSLYNNFLTTIDKLFYQLYCRLLFQQHCNNYCSLSTSNNHWSNNTHQHCEFNKCCWTLIAKLFRHSASEKRCINLINFCACIEFWRENT